MSHESWQCAQFLLHSLGGCHITFLTYQRTSWPVKQLQPCLCFLSCTSIVWALLLANVAFRGMTPDDTLGQGARSSLLGWGI